MDKSLLERIYGGIRRATGVLTLFALVLLTVSASPVTGGLPGDAEQQRVVRCYPNPATSYINFEFPKEIDKSYSLLVFSFVGKKMTDVPVDNARITITLNDYYRGLYLYQLRDAGGKIVETGKFEVTK